MLTPLPSRCQSERGVVLLLALIALLLISAVGAAILYLAATETSLVGYQRSSTRVHTASLGGLEEARARLLTTDPYFLGNWQTLGIDFPNASGHVLYILNPAPGENVAPWDNSNPFYDWEYGTEFGTDIETIPACDPVPITSPPTVPPPAPPPPPCRFAIDSDMLALVASGISMPTVPYKWVRVTILTEAAAKRDIDGSGALDNAIPVYWEAGTNRMNINVDLSLDTNGNGVVEPDERIGRSVYRLTSLAQLPATGATRVAQYDVGPAAAAFPAPAAISLVGEQSSCGATLGVVENPPGSGNYLPVEPAIYIQGSGKKKTAMDGDNCSDCQGGPPEWTKKHARSSSSLVDGNDEAGPGGGPAIGYTDPATGADCFCEIRGSSKSGTVPPQCLFPSSGKVAYMGSDTTLQYLGAGCAAPPCLGDISGGVTSLDETSELLALINEIRANADVVVSASETPPQTDGNSGNNSVDISGITDWGTCDETASPPVFNPRTIVLDGDVLLDPNQNGCGLLLVTGDLTTKDDWQWKGVILAIGEGSFSIMGGGSGGVRGAIFVSRIYCDEGSHGASPDPADTLSFLPPGSTEPAPCPCAPGDPGCSTTPGVLDPPAGSSFRVSGGGNIGVRYNSTFIGLAFGTANYRVLAYREISR